MHKTHASLIGDKPPCPNPANDLIDKEIEISNRLFMEVGNDQQ